MIIKENKVFLNSEDTLAICSLKTRWSEYFYNTFEPVAINNELNFYVTSSFMRLVPSTVEGLFADLNINDISTTFVVDDNIPQFFNGIA